MAIFFEESGLAFACFKISRLMVIACWFAWKCFVKFHFVSKVMFLFFGDVFRE